MSDTAEQYEDIFEDDTENQPQGEQVQGPKALRDAYEKEKAARKQMEKDLNELRQTNRITEVSEKITSAGFPKGAAKYAADAEDLDKWMEENRELFAVSAPAQEDAPQNPAGNTALSEDQVAKMRATQSVQPGAYVPGSDDEVHTKVNAAATSAKSREEFYNALNGMGATGSIR